MNARASSPLHTSALLATLEPHLSRLSGVIVVDAGARAAELVQQIQSRGVGCAWLRVERKGDGRVDRGHSL